MIKIHRDRTSFHSGDRVSRSRTSTSSPAVSNRIRLLNSVVDVRDPTPRGLRAADISHFAPGKATFRSVGCRCPSFCELPTITEHVHLPSWPEKTVVYQISRSLLRCDLSVTETVIKMNPDTSASKPTLVLVPGAWHSNEVFEMSFHRWKTKDILPEQWTWCLWGDLSSRRGSCHGSPL